MANTPKFSVPMSKALPGQITAIDFSIVENDVEVKVSIEMPDDRVETEEFIVSLRSVLPSFEGEPFFYPWFPAYEWFIESKHFLAQLEDCGALSAYEALPPMPVAEAVG